ANATQMVNPAVITVTASPASRLYGQPNPAFSPSYSGFVLGQGLTSAGITGAPTLGTAATATSDVGTYPITVGVGSLSAANYTFTAVNGTLTINPLAVNLTGSRTYDGTTAAASSILTVSNAIAGDTVNVASGSGTLAGKDVGSRAITSF